MKKSIITILAIFGLALAFSAVQSITMTPQEFNELQFRGSEPSFGYSPLSVQQGGTGAQSFTAGECLVGNGTNAITTQVCGAGGGGGSAWSTSTDNLLYPIAYSTRRVLVGGNSTTTDAWFEVQGGAAFDEATSTNLAATTLCLTGDTCRTTWPSGSTATSSDYYHDDLTGFVENEHIDWTTDQGATNIHSGNYTDTDTNLTEEEVEDFVGGMLGGTETLITVTYQDGSNNIDFVVNDDLSLYDNTTSGFITSADDSVSGSELDGVFSSNGLLKRTGASTYTVITDSSSNWDTAYGWGDHAGLYDVLGQATSTLNSHTTTYNHANFLDTSTVLDGLANVDAMAEADDDLLFYDTDGWTNLAHGSDGEYLKYTDAGGLTWGECGTGTGGATTLGGLADVESASSTGDILYNNSGMWTATSSLSISDSSININSVSIDTSGNVSDIYNLTTLGEIEVGTSLKIIGQTAIIDGNDRTILETDQAAVGTNYFILGNANAGTSTKLITGGSDDNVGMVLDTKGTGLINFYYAYTLPSSDGTNGQILSTDGSGTLSWGDVDYTVTASDLGGASANIAADGTIEWEDAGDLDADGTLSTGSVADNEIDYANVTLSDLTFDEGSVSKTEFGYLDGVTHSLNEKEIFNVCIASTSQAFVSGGTLPVPPMEKAYTVTAINCYVSGGTSAVVTLSDGTNDMDSVTCGTTLTTDDGTIANSSATAGELMQLDFGTITGEVNYVCYSAYGTN